jgi:hypothetical protein
MTGPVDLARGLTNYGDPDFALYLRRSFARSMGSSDLLTRRVIAIADSFSGVHRCKKKAGDWSSVMSLACAGSVRAVKPRPARVAKRDLLLVWTAPNGIKRARMRSL